jgi:hypothetical protein
LQDVQFDYVNMRGVKILSGVITRVYRHTGSVANEDARDLSVFDAAL